MVARQGLLINSYFVNLMELIPLSCHVMSRSFYHRFIYTLQLYRDANKSLARPTSRYILFDGESISFEASLVIYIYITNIPPIMIINRIYELQTLLSL